MYKVSTLRNDSEALVLAVAVSALGLEWWVVGMYLNMYDHTCRRRAGRARGRASGKSCHRGAAPLSMWCGRSPRPLRPGVRTFLLLI